MAPWRLEPGWASAWIISSWASATSACSPPVAAQPLVYALERVEGRRILVRTVPVEAHTITDQVEVCLRRNTQVLEAVTKPEVFTPGAPGHVPACGLAVEVAVQGHPTERFH
mmetsp:Transcript_31809/g.62549  ORF Transcript_31809/g.62549 Transcript_31809/m.62549 type:complete len:112 (+) Transcript_31809:218-553(+)